MISKKIVFGIIFFVILSLALGGCNWSRKPAYFIGSTWAEKGNTFCIESATWADSYTPENGEIMHAGLGWRFLVLSCKMELGDGWEIANCTAKVLFEQTDTVALYKEPINLLGESQRYIFLFHINQKQTSEENLSQYSITLELRNGAEHVEEDFYLQRMK